MSCGIRRIVLSTLGSLGDLHPMMALGLALRNRGHAVTVATSDFYRDRIARAGLGFSAIRPAFALDDASIIRQAMHSRNGPEYLIRTLLLPHLGDMYADLLTATRGADLLVAGEIVFAAPLVAEVRQLPWAAAILAPFSLFSIHDPGVLPLLPLGKWMTRAPAGIQDGLLALARALTRKWGEPIADFRAALGLRRTPDPLFRDRFSPLLNLALFSDVLGTPQPDWPRNTVQTGFVFYDAAQEISPATPIAPQLEAFLAEGPPPIVFTLGSTAVMDAGDFFEESAAAARSLGARAVLLLGRNRAPAGTSSDLIACDYAPYSRVFPQAACIVHQGGVGTTAQALAAGVPQLVMPYAFDQPDNALRVARMGAGLSVARTRYRAGHIARLLKELLTDARYRQRARAIGERVRSQQGIETACDAIERLLATQPGGHGREVPPSGSEPPSARNNCTVSR